MTRRLLASPVAPGAPACSAAAVPSWCWGARDGALGTCDGLEGRTFCFSSADDRPAHFLTPLEYSDTPQRGGLAEAALGALKGAVGRLGGVVEETAGPSTGSAGYLWAYFPDGGAGPSFGSGGGTDVEWVFLPDDDVVDIRALSRGGGSILGNALERRRAAQLLRDLRRELGWQEVPVMRYRERALGVVESPLDRFGPEAPPSVDYAKDLPPDAELRTSRPWNVD